MVGEAVAIVIIKPDSLFSGFDLFCLLSMNSFGFVG
jgi:hypothetical protein